MGKPDFHPACVVCRGACCESITLDLRSENADVQRWLDLHGQRVVGGLNLACACSALREGRCTIYDDRPRVCRDYAVGSAACLAAIARRRPEPARAVILARLEGPDHGATGQAAG